MPGNLRFISCFSDCEKEEACSFVTVTPAGSEAVCELYSASEVNFNCTTSGLVKMMIFKYLCLLQYYRFNIIGRRHRRKTEGYLTTSTLLFVVAVYFFEKKTFLKVYK